MQTSFASTAANITTATASMSDSQWLQTTLPEPSTNPSWPSSQSTNTSTRTISSISLVISPTSAFSTTPNFFVSSAFTQMSSASQVISTGTTTSTSSVVSPTSAFSTTPDSLTTSFVKPTFTQTSSASQVISPSTPTATAAQVVCPSANHAIVGLGAGLGIPLALILLGYLMFLAWWYGRHSHDSITSADTNIQPRIGASLQSLLINQHAATDRESGAPSAARSIAELAAELRAAELAAEREAAELEARSAKHRCRCGEVAPSSGVGSAESKDLASL